MWQRFTERARKVVFFAQEEAQKFGEGYVSSEHLLLGLLRESDSVGVRVIEDLGVDRERVREEVERQLPRIDSRPYLDMSLTPRAKRVIDLAYDEARNLGNNYIGTEHLLLGLIREGEGLAGRVLDKLGVHFDQARLSVKKLQGDDGGGERKGGMFGFKMRKGKEPDERDSGVPWSRLVTTVIDYSRWEAEVFEGSDEIQPLHLMLAIVRLSDCTGARVLERTGVDLDRLRGALDAKRSLRESHSRLVLRHSKAVNEVIKRAEQLRDRARQMCTEHLVLALLELGREDVTSACAEFGVTIEKYRFELEKFYESDQGWQG